MIQSGVDTVTVNVDSSFNPVSTTSSLVGSNGAPLPGLNFGTPTDGTAGVPLDGYFDKANGTIVLEEIKPEGGSITLAGQILSTGNGDLVAAHGYANVSINNTSNFPVVLNGIDTDHQP